MIFNKFKISTKIRHGLGNAFRDFLLSLLMLSFIFANGGGYFFFLSPTENNPSLAGIPVVRAALDPNTSGYIVAIGPVPGTATVGYVYASIFNPVGSGHAAVFQRLRMAVDASAAAAWQTLTLRRITAASGGTLIASSSIPLKNTSSSYTAMEIRSTGVTVTFDATPDARFNSVIGAGAAGAYIGKDEIVFDNTEPLVLQPGEGIALYQEAAGSTAQSVRLTAGWQEQASPPSAQNEYSLAYPRVAVAATANYNYATFMNPAASGKTALVKRLSIDIDANANAVYTNDAYIRRITAASGGYQIAATNAVKKNTSSATSIMDIRCTSSTTPTSTLAGTTDSKLMVVSAPGAANQPQGHQEILIQSEDEPIVLQPGEGLALLSNGVGSAAQFVRLSVVWQEVASPPATQNEYMLGVGRIAGVATTNYNYFNFFNPAASGKNAIVKRLGVLIDANAAATYATVSYRRTTASSGGTQIAVANVPKKNSGSANTAMDIRYAGATSTLVGTAAARIMSVITPGAVAQLTGQQVVYFSSSEHLVLKPGEGITLIQETAGSTAHLVKAFIEWEEETNAPAAANEYYFTGGPIAGNTAANYNYVNFFNPVGSGKYFMIKRISTRIDQAAAAAYLSASVRRITASSAGTAVAATDIVKKNTGSASSAADIRTTGATSTLAGTAESRLITVLTPGALPTAVLPQLSGYEEHVFVNGAMVLRPGEGITFYQEAAGNANHRFQLILEWSEDASPVTSTDYTMTIGPVTGAAGAGTAYASLFNPAASGKNYLVKRISMGVDAAAAAVYATSTVRRITSSSGGTQVAVANIPKKDTTTANTTADVRYGSLTVSLADATSSRIVSRTTPGAAGQAIGSYEIIVAQGDEFILQPGQGIVLFQESAGSTGHRFQFKITWSESDTVKYLYVGATAGGMVAGIASGGTSQYANDPACSSAATCTAFTIASNGGSTILTSIKITETGTVDASNNLSNLALFYDTDGDYSNGTTGQYGATVASFTTETATITGSLVITAGITYYFYVRYDLAKSSTYPKGGQTVNFEIAADGDITQSNTHTVTGAPVSLAGGSIAAPHIASATYGSGLSDGARSGESVTLSGYGFGAPSAGANRADCSTATVDYGCIKFTAGGTTNVSASDITAWSNTSITFTVSSTLATEGGGSALEVVAASQGDPQNLTYYIYPNITAVSALSTLAGREYNSSDTDGLVYVVGDHLGSVVPQFGTGGVINGSTTTNKITSLAQDSTYLYAFGQEGAADPYNWHIEKRLLSDGSLVAGFGSGGIISVPSSTSKNSGDMAIDTAGGYMYLVGDSGCGCGWHIEKRLLSDGSLVPSFGTNGGWLDTSGASVKATSIVIDTVGGFMYVAGYQYNTNDDWLVQKRLLSDGTLVATFGNNGSVSSDATSYRAYGLAIDSTYMYVAGSEGTSPYNCRVEKRLLSTGATSTGFGVDGILTASSTCDEFYAITIDSSGGYMYLGGDNDTTWDTRLEKRLLSDGSGVASFGTNGVKVGTANIPVQALILSPDKSSLYVTGGNDWRTEKRYTSNGSYDTSFGGGTGAVTSDPDSYWATGFVADSNYMYLGGSREAYDWRMEKRLISTGALADGTGGSIGSATILEQAATTHTFGGGTNISDSSNFNALASVPKQVVRSSSGTLYSILATSTSLQAWKSLDGLSWTRQDIANSPTVSTTTPQYRISAAIDGNNDIHISYVSSSTNKVVSYVKYSTSNDLFGSPETISALTRSSVGYTDIAVDSNNKPHIVWQDGRGPDVGSRYSNKVSGSWSNSISFANGQSNTSANIIIDNNNLPIITATYYALSSKVEAYIGNQNNATSLDLKTLNSGPGAYCPSLAASDISNNIWVVGCNSDNTGLITIHKHVSGDAWSTWQASTTNSGSTFSQWSPSIATVGSDLYVFYINSLGNVVYDKYNGSTWAGEEILEPTTGNTAIQAKWSKYFNNGGASQIDYLYLNSNDVYWNKISLSSSNPCSTGGWSSTATCLEIPTAISDSLYTGNIVVTRGSDSKTATQANFRILPRILTNTPSSTATGSTVQILGNHLCQTGTCPAASSSMVTVSDNLKFGSTTSTLTDFQSKTGGAGACNGTGYAWTHTEICSKVPVDASGGSQPSVVTSNSYVSNQKPLNVSSTVPNIPTNLRQFKSDGTTTITTGTGKTGESSVKIKADISASVSQTMIVQVEIKKTGTAFDGTGIIDGSGCTGTSCADASATITGLTNTSPDGQYHWQARTKNTTTGQTSAWVSFNGGSTAFTVDVTAPVITSGPLHSNVQSNSATISWTTDELASTQVMYATSSINASGYITRSTSSTAPTSIARDPSYIYITGKDTNNKCFIEKRLVSNGSLGGSFGSGGLLTYDSLCSDIYDISIDSTYMYLVGRNSSNNTRIEKRLLSDGSLVAGFGTSGIITGSTTSTFPAAIAIDSTYMYITDVYTSGLNYLRVEKRLLSDGSLVAGFGVNGVVQDGTYSGYSQELAIDSTYMYILAGGIQKRLLSTGALVAGFGTNGIADIAPFNEYAIAIDSTYMYVTGSMYEMWRTEKRLLSTGALVPGFGEGGYVTGSSGVVNDISIDSTNMYIIGYFGGDFGFPGGWANVQKRLLSDGSLISGFGNNGDIVYGPSTQMMVISVDSNNVYTGGAGSNGRIFIEKRLVSNGGFDTNFGDVFCSNNCTTLKDVPPSGVKSHSQGLTNLDSGTTYYYRVRSKDELNNEVISSQDNFPTASVTEPAKSVMYEAMSIASPVNGGATASSSFDIVIPETSVSIKSAIVDIRADYDTTGADPNGITVQVNNEPPKTYDLPSDDSSDYIEIMYEIHSPNVSPSTNTLYITPEAETNLYSASADVEVTYSYEP